MQRSSSQLGYQRGVSIKMEILNLNDSENISVKIKQNPTVVVKPCGSYKSPPEYYKMSTEVQTMSYSDQSFKVASVPVTHSNTQVVRFNPLRTALVKYQPEEDILSVCLEQESKRTLPVSVKPSSHFAEGVRLEPPQQPVMVIVSKHEFETILLNKKKFYSKSEALLPVVDKLLFNCRMDICVYDVELDNHLLDQLSNLDRAPYMYVTWSFLGLQQRTVSMPASNAQFCTTVTYFGPVTEPMVEHVKENELTLYLMLERTGGGSDTLVGQGQVSLMPALEQPSRGFVRCVPLYSKLGGQANVNVSFKMHECCETLEPPPVPTSLEVGIGSLRLNSTDYPATPEATHLYVEYNLLGYCGPELETDSMPRTDVIRFNYTKRLNVNDNNSNKLDPLLAIDDTQSLRFNIIAEPCSLDSATDVQEIGYAEVNLLKDMVHKEEDIISKQLPVYNKEGGVVGNLSVTVIGISTLQNRQQHLRQA